MTNEICNWISSSTLLKIGCNFFFINRFVIDVVAGRILGYNYTPIDVYIYIYKISWNSIELIQYLICKDPGMTNQFENKF